MLEKHCTCAQSVYNLKENLNCSQIQEIRKGWGYKNVQDWMNWFELKGQESYMDN